ncbi:YtzI protein [Bacillus sp. FJAT-27251]|uniref:YtzI protein n=1 Tax=Bacillus sp. FJAT-27251 TaxID=1684142 RepID=UPI0009E61BE3|nr:YtzI protein [Bacillus sp. FJAT-27251]
MYIVLILSVIIVLIVLILAVGTTSKAYGYKHTVDSLEENPHINQTEGQEKEKK